MCRMRRMRNGPHNRECRSKEFALSNSPPVNMVVREYSVIPKPVSRKSSENPNNDHATILFAERTIRSIPPGKVD